MNVNVFLTISPLISIIINSFLNFVSIVFLLKVIGISMQQSLCFFVLLNLDFSCELSEITNEYIFGSNQAIRKNLKSA